MPHRDPSIRFLVRARTPGAPAPRSVATDLNRLDEALGMDAEEIALEAQVGDALPRLMGTWRETPRQSSAVPGVVYDYSAQLAGNSNRFNLPRVEVYFTREQWLDAVRKSVAHYLAAKGSDRAGP